MKREVRATGDQLSYSTTLPLSQVGLRALTCVDVQCDMLNLSWDGRNRRNRLAVERPKSF